MLSHLCRYAFTDRQSTCYNNGWIVNPGFKQCVPWHFHSLAKCTELLCPWHAADEYDDCIVNVHAFMQKTFALKDATVSEWVQLLDEYLCFITTLQLQLPQQADEYRYRYWEYAEIDLLNALEVGDHAAYDVENGGSMVLAREVMDAQTAAILCIVDREAIIYLFRNA